MRDAIVLVEFGCRLRFVCEDDAGLIVSLRNQAQVKGVMHPIAQSIDDQRKWLSQYKLRKDDYYWIIESAKTGAGIGTLGLSHVKMGDGCREGVLCRWVMYPQMDINVMAPIFIVYDFSFQTLGLDRVIFDVAESNRKVLRFHSLYGARRISLPERFVEKYKNNDMKTVWFEVTKEMWKQIREEWHPVLKSFQQ